VKPYTVSGSRFTPSFTALLSQLCKDARDAPLRIATDSTTASLRQARDSSSSIVLEQRYADFFCALFYNHDFSPPRELELLINTLE
jgi:hypothetical protein